MSRLPDKPATRRQLAAELAVNAATKPVNVAVGAAVAVAGLLLGTGWLVALAAVFYVSLCAVTFFDAGEAEALAAKRRRRTLDRAGSTSAEADAAVTDPAIRGRLTAALREEQLLRAAIADSDLALVDLSGEVDGLITSLRTIARRAQKLSSYLASADRGALARRITDLQRSGGDAELLTALEGQQATLVRMDSQLGQFDAQLEHATAVLATMRGQVVTMSVQADSLAERKLSEQARDLADQVTASAQAMAELAATADD